MPRLIGRRMFLRGAGGVALGLPLLSSLVPRELAAQTTGAPRRFISLVTFNGQPSQHWYPTHTPAGYQLTDTVFDGQGSCPGRPCNKDGTTYLHGRLPEDNRYGYAPLTDFKTDTGISPVLHEALNPFLEKMTLLRGLDFLCTTGHSNGSTALGNYAASGSAEIYNKISPIPTIDEVMAYSDKVYSSMPKTRALHLSCGWADSGSTTNYGIAGGPVEKLDGYSDPAVIWQQLFLGVTADPAPKVDPNLSFLNAVYGDYKRLNQHARLSAKDRQLLDRHMTFLAEIEAGIKNFQAISCTPPAEPGSINAWHLLEDPDQLRSAIGLLIDLAVAAVICDLTRIVTFSVSNALHDGEGTWQTSLTNSADIPSDWHHYAHFAYSEPSSMKNLLALNRWLTKEVFAQLLTKLDVVEGSDGSTVLDNSLVVWGNELSLNHYNTTMPTLMAGSAGGKVKTNRYIDYCQWQNIDGNPIEQGILIPGVPHNRYLVTCMQAMGLSPSDYESGGLQGYGSHESIEPPNGMSAATWDMSEIGKPLAGVLA